MENVKGYKDLDRAAKRNRKAAEELLEHATDERVQVAAVAAVDKCLRTELAIRKEMYAPDELEELRKLKAELEALVSAAHGTSVSYLGETQAPTGYTTSS